MIKLFDRADQISRVRILAAGCRESGLWLNALPYPALGTLLDSETFRISVAFRVGAEVCQPHTCRCRKKMDALGVHGLSCKYSAGRHLKTCCAKQDGKRRNYAALGVHYRFEPIAMETAGISMSARRAHS